VILSKFSQTVIQNKCEDTILSIYKVLTHHGAFHTLALFIYNF